MRLHFIRHADPDYPNHTITEDGHKEARALAERIKHYGINKLYSSPQKRALDTAEYTKKLCGSEISILPFLHEIDVKEFLPSGFICPFDLPGESLFHDLDSIDMEKILEIRKEKTKSLDELLLTLGYERKEDHYEELEENHEDVYFFTHAGTEGLLLSYLLSIPLNVIWADFWFAPSSVTTLVFDKRNGKDVYPRCIELNDTSHLYKEGLPVKPRGFKGNFR